ncbi:MAG: DUF1836 domain-containing protein [Clostridia bacterium]|nr:DUF1836 domain-containing protein [Clostridia bacterium]
MYNKEELIKYFNDWEQHLKKQKIPGWDDLPNLELYMDQVLFIVNQYNNILNAKTENAPLTSPMINNYVKHKTIPAPVKKKYSRVHIAYLIMLCTLKQALSISTIEKILPIGLEEEEVKKRYESFIKNQQKAIRYVSEQVTKVSNPILNEEDDPDRINDLVWQLAISANIFKTLTEQMTVLTDDKQ